MIFVWRNVPEVQIRLYVLRKYSAFGTWWKTVAHGRGCEGERCEWSRWPGALQCTSEHGLYNRCPLIRTTRLPVVDWTDTPRRFKWTRPLRWRTKSGFCACASTFRTCYNSPPIHNYYTGCLTTGLRPRPKCCFPGMLSSVSCFNFQWLLHSYSPPYTRKQQLTLSLRISAASFISPSNNSFKL